MHTTLRFQDSQRGALLIVALLLCTIIGISLISYVQLSRTTFTISNRGLYNNAAVNLAEQGVEEATYSINQYNASATYAWPGWTIAGNNAQQKWTGIPLGQNATAQNRVFIYNHLAGATPKVVSRATVTLGSGGAPIEKWLEVTLSRPSMFGHGLVAKNTLVFNGTNPTADSWNSEKNPDGSARLLVAAYSSAVRDDNVTIGSTSSASGAVDIGNADVWGYVANNSHDSSQPPLVGSTGSVLGADSPVGSVVDPNRLSTTFSATFNDVKLPTGSLADLGNINNNLTLPRAADIAGGPNGMWDPLESTCRHASLSIL